MFSLYFCCLTFCFMAKANVLETRNFSNIINWHKKGKLMLSMEGNETPLNLGYFLF